MSFEKGTGPWQITKKVLDDYEKKNPMTDGSKESDYLSDIVVEAENIYWEKHPKSEKGEMEFFDSVHDRLIAEIRKIIAAKKRGRHRMNFDLTTKKGQKEASQYLVPGLLGITLPLGIAAWLISKNKKSASRQGELAERLIKTGKENGVDNFEITVDKKVGSSFETNIKGVSINSMLGSDDKMTLKVQYK